MRTGFRLLIFLVGLPWLGFAQYSNDWIRTDQRYYKIPVASKGVYRLTYSDLVTAGLPLNSIDPRRIQIFHRGLEQAIFVQGQADAVFDPADYVEFYGTGNDGTLDKDLYKPRTAQPHTYYNLYSDTTSYFLTWQLSAVQGKRVTNFSEVNVSNIPKEVSHQQERILINSNQYSGGDKVDDVIQYTHFDVGEGWTGTALQGGQSVDYSLDLVSQTVTAVGDPQLEIVLVGRDQISHTAEIYVGPSSSSLRLLDTHSFIGYTAEKLTYSILWSDIGPDGKFAVRFTAPPAATNRFQFSVSYIKLSFPQNFEASGVTHKTYYLNPNPTNKSYIELDNAAANLRVWDVTDPTAIVSIGTTLTGSTIKAVVPSTLTARSLFVFNSTKTPSIKLVSFRSISPAQAGYVVITHKSLMQSALGYANPVKAYAGYRASEAGGLYDTLVVTVDQLYNQFNYGETSPRAIYEFMRYLVEGGSPKYLFLIGKGRDVSAGFHRLVNPPITILKDLVPSAGSPAADVAFTAGLNGTSFEPAVPTGRLSASTPSQVAAYLNKIKEIEMGLIAQPWQKRGLHLSGGIQPNELIAFREYVDGFKAIAEDTLWGGSIATIGKRDPNPVELINISDKVNEGVNLITFFGHSSPSTIDIDIGFVSDPTMGYNNPGKYPTFLINGCNAGNFFSGSTSFGEDWILTANKGARSFIAHSSFGFVYSLRYYSDLFYQIGLSDSNFVNRGIGDVQKEVARQYMAAAPATIANITQVQQMVLLGDPAVRLFNYSKPDYEITPASLSLASLDSKPVTIASDSFAVKILVKNLGLAKPVPLEVKLIRTRGDGSQVSYDSVFGPVLNMDTLLFIIQKESNSGGGNNQFTVTIDPMSKIDEINESNNEATFTAFIPSNATRNLFPHSYSIVNQNKVKLVWQSTNLVSPSRPFIVEVDTTSQFNSPFLIQREISGKVLASTEVDLANRDSTVYFWRTRFKNPQTDESTEWATTTFSFIIGSGEGWAQLRNSQLAENNFISLIADGSHFRFEETRSSVVIKTFGSGSPLPATDASIKINNAEFNLATQGQPCRNNTLNFVAFNKTTAAPYAGIPFIFQDPRTCGREPQVINSFTAAELENDLAGFINAVGMSDSVAIFSIGNAGYASWSNAVKSKLGALGIGLAELNDLQPGEPIIAFGKKGATAGSVSLTRALLSPANEQVIVGSQTITGRKTEGTMKSVVIGPAAEWKQFIAQANTLESDDELSFSMYGISLGGIESLISSDVGMNYDLSSILAEEFPYLKIVFQTKDEINLTPALWKNWIVLYEPLAEGILFWKETDPWIVQEGESWRSTYGFTNISTKNFKSPLHVDIEIFTKKSQNREKQDFIINAPIPGDTTFFEVSSPTLGKIGFNDVNLFVNKRIIAEPYYDNNYIGLSDYLLVQADKTPPVLQVTFDGRTLRNKDFVSSTPFINISLKDENIFRLKSDTVGVTLLLSYPCPNSTCPFTRIALNGKDAKWFSATENSDFRIEFMPTLADGDYKLSVQAADVNGNWSGDVPYEISFTVKSEPTLEFVGVHPNPSSSNFFFNFILTGNKLPDEFLLELFTLDGQRVQTFTANDIQKFHVGTNELMWNSRDASDGFLPRGFYVYRMRIKAGSIDKTAQGKIVIIR
ncbi:MAG: hypothetical protein JNM78_02500 [Cyclobacteriaceae bacterium]|nr:hypothetical protein [Cyclobacteriaceae bacterium]